MKKIAVFALSVLLTIILLTGDVLGFGDFDSGSDFGGWDSGSDYGSDYDSGSWYDDSGSGWYDSDSGDSEMNPVEAALITIILLSVGIWWIREKVKNNPTARRGNPRVDEKERALRAKNAKRTEELILKQDPEYSREKLEAFVNTLYRDMQEGWEKHDISAVRTRFMPDTWHRFNTQLEAKAEAGETAHVRDITLYDFDVIDGGEGRGGLYLTVRFTARNIIWTTDRNGKIISGSTSRMLDQTFEYTLVLIPGGAGEISCPNCGHTVDASAFASCPFCGTEFPPAGGWLLQEIRNTAQRTLHG